MPATAVDAEVRLYDRLFSDPAPDAHEDRDFTEFLNPDSLDIKTGCKLEPSLGGSRSRCALPVHPTGLLLT